MNHSDQKSSIINTVQSSLGIRLFISYLIVILAGTVAIGITARFTTPRAFEHHMMPFGAQFGMSGMMDDLGRNRINREAMTDLYTGFQSSFYEALILSLAVAAVVAMIVSLVLTRRIVSPLRAMMNASKRIASGQYKERVNTSGSDEVSQLAVHFNQMAGQLEKVESMRRRLIGDVAHELRTPLAAIQGSMEGLVDGKLPTQTDTFEQIHAEAKRLARLVDDLQELSRVESGAYDLRLHPVDISDIMKTVIKRFNSQFLEKQIELKLDFDQGSIYVNADEDRVVQILTNLLDNALQHTPRLGIVTLSTLHRGKEVEISVTDTGEGITAEHLPFLFDRFYRVDQSRSRTRGGSGIGLTIAKHLVEGMGGRIWVESKGESKGSAFKYTLPLAHV